MRIVIYQVNRQIKTTQIKKYIRVTMSFAITGHAAYSEEACETQINSASQTNSIDPSPSPSHAYVNSQSETKPTHDQSPQCS